MKTKKIPCAQDLLYLVATLAWNNCRSLLPVFTAFKPKYTEVYIEQMLNAVLEAAAIANLRQRNLTAKDKRDEFKQVATEVRNQWQSLKRYIDGAYTGKQVESMYISAGQSYYEASSSLDIQQMQYLISAAQAFITTNRAQLLANGNMPRPFADTFAELMIACTALMEEVATVEQQKSTNAAEKLNANDVIYASLISMLKDGQQIFKKDKANRQKFVFSHLLRMVKSSRPATISGRVYLSEKLPAAGVVITLAGGRYTATTDSKGYYKIAAIAGGNYVLSLLQPGKPSVEIPVTIRPGVHKYFNYTINLVSSFIANEAAA